MQASKSISSNSASGSKSKKNSKNREKRKSQTGTSQSDTSLNEKDKGSPSKDCKEYAGISSDSICIYAEQSTYEHLSEDVCNTLAEDINYKLRYIIHESFIKARLLGRDSISSNDIEETFSSLNINKVYGAPSNPSWVPFGDQNLLYLDDTKINLIEIAEDEEIYGQESDAILLKRWYSEQENQESSEAQDTLKEYFTSISQALISNEADIRNIALKDISENSSIGPITEWFYHFAYFLLMKNITYDCLTLRALNLLEVLENSPLSSQNVSEKQLKLLVRLLLQRLLISATTKEILTPMCSVLATLCLREPLREMVLLKIYQKMAAVCHEMALPLLTIIYFLGINAVTNLFLPNMNYFLTRIMQQNEADLKYITLAIYGLICKADINENDIHNCFHDAFGNLLIIFWKPLHYEIKELVKEDIDFINIKKQLIKTRRKVDCNVKKGRIKQQLEEVFTIPSHNCIVKNKLDEHHKIMTGFKKETRITVGKTSLLLSILKSNKNKVFSKNCDHSMLAYNL